MGKKDIEIVASLLPVAITLTSRIVALAKEIKADGVEIPDLDSLKKLNAELKELEDL